MNRISSYGFASSLALTGRGGRGWMVGNAGVGGEQLSLPQHRTAISGSHLFPSFWRSGVCVPLVDKVRPDFGASCIIIRIPQKIR